MFKITIRNILFTFLIVLPVTASYPALQDYTQKDGHLILHFDVNKTLIAIDPAGGKDQPIVLNQLLSEEYSDRWDPELTSPITFRAYVHQYLVPGEKNDPVIKELRKHYTGNFISWLEEQNHPYFSKAQQEYDFLKEKLEGVFVFESFYRLLELLEKTNTKATVILRTFGSDIPDVTAEIEKRYSPANFTLFGEFRNGVLCADDSFYDSPESIQDLLKDHRWGAIHDHHSCWISHKKGKDCGKLFPYSLRDPASHEIFFDDNVELGSTKGTNIVNPVCIDAEEDLSVDDLAKQIRVVRVNTLKAILDENYYINLVEDSLQRKPFAPYIKREEREGSEEHAKIFIL